MVLLAVPGARRRPAARGRIARRRVRAHLDLLRVRRDRRALLRAGRAADAPARERLPGLARAPAHDHGLHVVLLQVGAARGRERAAEVLGRPLAGPLGTGSGRSRAWPGRCARTWPIDGAVAPSRSSSASSAFENALPQYAVGHRDRVARIEQAMSGAAGLILCGAAYRGVGVASCIVDGQAAAEKAVRSLGAAAGDGAALIPQ